MNKYQSKIDKDKLPKEVYSDLLDALNYSDFISWMIADDRPYVKQMPKDDQGRVIVNITQPHILENVDYFRQAAIHFQKYGCYTTLTPSTHPASEYVRFWKEERRRCREGLVREDGEWITGDHYFYLNYVPILKTNQKGEKVGDRVEDFPDLWDGDYLYFHYKDQARFKYGAHGAVLKARGRGFSFKAAASLAKILLVGESEKVSKKVKAFAIAAEREFLMKDGVLEKFLPILDHCAQYTEFPRIMDLKASSNDMHWKIGYTEAKTGIDRGSQNEVIGVTLKNDPQKARGKRGVLIIFEESGKFPDLITAWQIARPSVEDGGVTFGFMIAYGTGGTLGADFAGIEELFYNPIGYNIHSLPNVFDKNTAGRLPCAFFFGVYMNRKGYYDENGNTDVVGSLISVLKDGLISKYNTNDPNSYVQFKAENPIYPQDAVMRREGNMFPIADLKDYLAEISPNLKHFLSSHYVGRLSKKTDGTVTYEYDDSIPVIRDFPLRDNFNKYGAVEIYDMPVKGSDGKIDPWRYLGGIDTYDDDYSTTTSLGSIFILDLFTDRIVAEYTGRPLSANDFYETCARLLKFYNAKANYENNKKGLFAYFDTKGYLYHLVDTPQILMDKELVTSRGFGNKLKGTIATTPINVWGRRLQADWLISNAVGTEVSHDDGTITTKLNLQTLRSLGYIKELISWNPDGNFDRVSAMGMLMILREDRLKYLGNYRGVNSTRFEKDSFFDRHIKTRVDYKKVLENIEKGYNKSPKLNITVPDFIKKY